MATSKILLDGPRHLSIQLMSEGTDETTAVTKVDRDLATHGATIAGSASGYPRKTLDKLAIEEVYWSVDGYEDVIVQWLFAAGVEQALILGAGEGYVSYEGNGVLKPDTARSATATDGDLQVRTGSASATGNYTIKIRLRKCWIV